MPKTKKSGTKAAKTAAKPKSNGSRTITDEVVGDHDDAFSNWADYVDMNCAGRNQAQFRLGII